MIDKIFDTLIVLFVRSGFTVAILSHQPLQYCLLISDIYMRCKLYINEQAICVVSGINDKIDLNLDLANSNSLQQLYDYFKIEAI